jgi:hypothetical protein
MPHGACLTEEVRTKDLSTVSRVLPQKLIVTQLVKKFPAFYGTRRFITVFTRTRHWSLSWARWIQSTPSHTVSLRSILMLTSYLRLCLPSGLFPSSFPTKILYAFLISSMCSTYVFHPVMKGCRYKWLEHKKRMAEGQTPKLLHQYEPVEAGAGNVWKTAEYRVSSWPYEWLSDTEGRCCSVCIVIWAWTRYETYQKKERVGGRNEKCPQLLLMTCSPTHIVCCRRALWDDGCCDGQSQTQHHQQLAVESWQGRRQDVAVTSVENHTSLCAHLHTQPLMKRYRVLLLGGCGGRITPPPLANLCGVVRNSSGNVTSLYFM